MSSIKCGVATCRYPSKKFGVCGIHKRSAFRIEPSDIEGQRIHQRLQTAMKEYQQEAVKLENQGHDILHAQAYLNPNLTTPDHLTPSVFTTLIILMDEVKTHIKELQALPTCSKDLGYNLSVRANHSYSPRPCPCAICRVGQ